MNTTGEVEALPADVAVLAAESDLGVGGMLIIFAIPLTWAAVSKITTAVARNAYGWELVLYGGPPAFLLFVCARILDPRIRRMRFYGFARGFILRDSRMQLTDASWVEVVRMHPLPSRTTGTIRLSQAGAPGWAGRRCQAAPNRSHAQSAAAATR